MKVSDCSRSPRNTYLIVFLVMLWGQFCFALVPSWINLPSYRYGLLGAPCVFYFVFRRWKMTSLMASPKQTRVSQVGFSIVMILALCSLFLIRPLERLDHFWRLPLWLHAGCVLVATVCALGICVGWKRSWLLIPTFFFVFVLIPLPSALEGVFIGNLTRVVSTTVGEILPLAGYPIDRTGNSMLVNGMILDVAEGCCGMRSFQASFMMGLFLGEFYQHGVGQRLILLLVAVGLAMLGNGIRIFYLTTVAFRDGIEAEARVHDTAGSIALSFIYGAIGLCGWWLTIREASVGKRTLQKEVQR